jgi:hypothetical protein
VNVDRLVRLAASADATIEVLVVVGETVVESTPVLRVIGGRVAIDESALLSAIELDVERTFEQDPKYAIRLLVDIAIRALSPAVNDPTTAVQALDQIGDLLLRLSRRRIERGAFRDAAGRLRVIMPVPTWDDFLWLAFGEIHAYGATSLQVVRRMHALVADLLAAVPDERRLALQYWQARLKNSVAAHFSDPAERAVATAEDRQGLGLTRRSVQEQRSSARRARARELLLVSAAGDDAAAAVDGADAYRSTPRAVWPSCRFRSRRAYPNAVADVADAGVLCHQRARISDAHVTEANLPALRALPPRNTWLGPRLTCSAHGAPAM